MPDQGYIPAIPTDEYDPQWLLTELNRIQRNLSLQNFWSVPRVMQVRFAGDAVPTNDPVLETAFNVASVTREGVGHYRATIATVPSWGVQAATIYTGFQIAISATSEAFQVRGGEVSSTVFDLFVEEQILGAGSKLEWVPYDLLAGDFIDALVLTEYLVELVPPLPQGYS